MHLTPLGAKVAQLEDKDRKVYGAKIVKGEDIAKYTQGVICYEAAAYVRYLLGNKITAKELGSLSGNAWATKLAFKSGSQWKGSSSIPTGYAVGFFRQRDKAFFHAAVAVGGTSIRAVNGLLLGAGWSHVVDLKKQLGTPDSEGWFDYDGGKIQVYMSKV